jgi:hypothetical protein
MKWTKPPILWLRELHLVAQASEVVEKLATCHSEGLGLPEESAFS